jgi:hypothetical protein
LTPSARSANLITGRKTAFPAPNKKLSAQPKQPLDRKSPIQVRIRFAPPASQRTLGPSRDEWSASRKEPRAGAGGVDWYYFIERLEKIFIERRWNSSDPFVFGGNVLIGVVREQGRRDDADDPAAEDIKSDRQARLKGGK